jgi:Uri superfamily endonuclease
LYIGSGQGRGSTSLEGRIARHLSQEKKNFWHIDGILSSDSVHVVSLIFARTTRKAECRVNAALLKDPDIAVLAKGVGSSDCKCESHFLTAKCRVGALREKVRKHYVRLGLRPQVPRDRGARLCRDTI